MSIETYQLKGSPVRLYFQLYKNLDNDMALSGELLTRHESGESARDLLSSITIDEHLGLIEWIVDSSNQLSDKFGLLCSINIDNNVVIDPKSREAFLRIAAGAKRSTTFEFTEMFAMPDAMDTNKMFTRLRDLGHTCALDDFGSGLNGMTMLTDYDFDIVKIDRALTVDIDVRPEKFHVLELLRQMIDALNKLHVVEGVESQSVFEKLEVARYRVFQGYLFGRPKPISELSTNHDLKEEPCRI